jgi:hypothetical protein
VIYVPKLERSLVLSYIYNMNPVDYTLSSVMMNPIRTTCATFVFII